MEFARMNFKDLGRRNLQRTTMTITPIAASLFVWRIQEHKFGRGDGLMPTRFNPPVRVVEAIALR
jgi:hypothetical protein